MNKAYEYKPNTLAANPDHGVKDGSIPRNLEGRLPTIDALHHYFIDDYPDKVYAEKDPDEDISNGEALAKIVAGTYGSTRVTRYIYENQVPDFSIVRDHSSFISGEVTEGRLPTFKQWLGYYMSEGLGNDYLVIDAEDYMSEFAEEEKVPAFNRLMSIAENSKEIIDHYLGDKYAKDGRGLLDFLNTQPTDLVREATYADPSPDYEGYTRWMWESKFLANELIKIPEFRCNFHTLVILNAQKHIHTGHLNLTKLYRLMANLGRVNTRLYFVG